MNVIDFHVKEIISEECDIEKWLEIHTKFKIGDKVYHPRICSEKKMLIDIREYYIVRIDINIDRRFKNITYQASPCREKVRGKSFRDGKLLFRSYEEAFKYVNQKGYLL